MKEEQKALVLYRLEQAQESLESAELLLEHDKLRPSVNRSYYAMFYAVLALLAGTQHKVSKHSGAIAVFNRAFVKKGIFSRDFSRWLQEAFDLRQRADYREVFVVSPERAENVLEHARTFVREVESQIRKTYLLN